MRAYMRDRAGGCGSVLILVLMADGLWAYTQSETGDMKPPNAHFIVES